MHTELLNSIMPPRIEDVKIYFNQKGMPEMEAESFFLFYEKKLWLSKRGHKLRSWKTIAYAWIASVTTNQPWLINHLIH